MLRLKDKVAIITGAAKGMGAADARLFAKEGASLILCDIDEPSLKSIAAELSDQGSKVLAIVHNVASEKDWQELAKQAEKHFGKVDILINNAGILNVAGIEATDMQLWNKIIEVNQTGVWLGMKYIVPLMRKSGGGSIVNTSSVYGMIGTGTSAAYQATKGAIRTLSKTAAMEFIKDKIRVNTIFPGAIDTGMVSGEISEEATKQILSLIPLGRMGKAEEVAYGVLYLASDESSYVTGAELVIDGGWTVP